jgi:hypothetical protein
MNFKSTNFFSVTTGFKKLKKRTKILVEKIFGGSRNFGGSDATIELNEK